MNRIEINNSENETKTESVAKLFRVGCRPINDRRIKSRRRFHKAFIRWATGNQARFDIPLFIKKRTDALIEIEFGGVTDNIAAQVNTIGIVVIARHDHKLWDILIEFEAYIKKSDSGYICEWCWENPNNIETDLKSFASRDELWRDHIFEPLLEWINTKLAKAWWVRFYGIPDSITAAQLIMQEAPEPRAGDLSYIDILAREKLHESGSQ